MAMPTGRGDREYKKFVETDAGETAVRTVGDTATLAGGASQSSGLAVYYGKPTGANGDAVTAYASATTLTITGLPFTFAAEDVESVEQIPTSGTSTVLSDKADYAVSGTTLTVTGATFAAADVFVVKLTGPVRGYDTGSNGVNTNDNAPLNSQVLEESLVDTTNVSAATHYYPDTTGGVMNPYQDQSLSGKFIDADGTLTLTLEVTNDEDTSGDWISAYFYDDKNNITTNTFTVTNGTLTFLASANDNNFRRYRWAVVASGATNTVILKERKKAL